MTEIYGIFGAGGYGREVMPLARNQLQKQGKNLNHLFYVVDHPSTEQVNGIQLISLQEYLNLEGKKFLSIAVADGKFRQTLKNKLHHENVSDWTIFSDNCVIMDPVQIGGGSIFNPFVTITANVQIGLSFHANLYSYVAHDCIIGDYVTFAPNVHCNGHIIIEDHVYVGTGAILRPGTQDKPLTIGYGAIIGMGAVVTKDVPPHVTVIGNPARIFEPQKQINEPIGL